MSIIIIVYYEILTYLIMINTTREDYCRLISIHDPTVKNKPQLPPIQQDPCIQQPFTKEYDNYKGAPSKR